MQSQVELLKAELDRARVERDRLRDTLEEIANAKARYVSAPSYSGGETWHGFAMRLRRLAVIALAHTDDAAAARALGREPCTHREGDGTCAACCREGDR